MYRKILFSAAILIGLGLISAVGIIGIFVYFSYGLPKISSLKEYRPITSSQILAKDGTVLAEIGSEKREIVHLNEVPKVVIDAFLSAEDDSFFHHKGVDYFGLIRAVLMNLKAGRVVQGGSTITQQIAKSLLLSKERSLSRKIKDFLLAQKIEEKFTKEEILFLYLNQVYFGGGYYGVKTAFHGYFDKELSEATIAESAMIAGLLVAPGKYSPYVNTEYSTYRQHYVLKRMYDTGKITKKQYENALNERIKFKVHKGSDFKAPYFTDWILQKLEEKYGEDSLHRDGLIIRTTLDYKLQEKAEKEVLKGVKDIDKRQGYKGPIGHLGDEDQRILFSKNSRQKIYHEASEYFIIDKKAKRAYQFGDEMAEEGSKNQNTQPFSNEGEINGQLYLPSGNKPNDFLFRALNQQQMNKSFQAQITYISDDLKLIFFDLGGLSGFIPFENFKWARERKISETNAFYGPMSKPSLILKPGDIILVTLSKLHEKLMPFLLKGKVDNILKERGRGEYLLGILDQEPELQGALLSLNSETGEVLAMVGGTDYEKSKFNRALQAKRQPGSSFKPFIYAMALENNFTPTSIIVDSPEVLSGIENGLNWKPKNYDGEFKGPVTLRVALEESRNIPTIKLAEKLGINKILSFLDRINFDAKISRDLSLALGTFGTTMSNLLTNFAIFANYGQKISLVPVTSVINRDGINLDLPAFNANNSAVQDNAVSSASNLNSNTTPPSADGEANPFLKDLCPKCSYDKRLSYLMVNLLKGVIQSGTATAAKVLGKNLAGKTGTTNDYVDAWFVGFSPKVMTAVWTGFDDNKTLGYGETGGKAPLPIWIEFMSLAMKKYPSDDFNIPPGIIHVLIDKKTGKPYRGEGGGGFSEAFLSGMGPGDEDKIQKTIDITPGSINSPERKTKMLQDDNYFDHQ